MRCHTEPSRCHYTEPKSAKMATIVELESWLIYQYVTTECSGCLFMTESAFKARDIGLRAQKKILSRMAGKNIARAFIDDTTASLLDNLYRLAKQYSNNKKEAEKLIKNIIKVVIKLGVLYRNNLLGEDDMRHAEKFKSKFRMAGMAIISFYEVDFSYDRNYLVQALDESQKNLQYIISKHLTDKSLSRVESVFSYFGNETFLDAIFKRDGEYRESLGRVVADLNKAIESGDL
ncbi:tumor necrosis factor alpha-induced protein 8-like protein isoform X2 [Cylas formicarius]|nr:tumor necrosis factor alpha-induced protein 8-like protein isoform X2 [Cylas formicarius]XP_060527277.1 tumor necrosis factor alpha-induced protein 8-like protein isoform X2 [Cylas formicarius]XP_060527278.1 tumor necrosis factor alpha-induced protein 8-like protein isoform X2 [Cylas formicarius]